MDETDDERMCLTYMGPGEGSGLQRTVEIYECFELPQLLSLYKRIRSNLIESSAKAKGKAFTLTPKVEKPEPSVSALSITKQNSGGATSPTKKKAMTMKPPTFA